MDRTSILGDTIDYMKELLDKIQKLREENVEEQRTQMHMMGSFKEIKPNEVLARNPPKVFMHSFPQTTIRYLSHLISIF